MSEYANILYAVIMGPRRDSRRNDRRRAREPAPDAGMTIGGAVGALAERRPVGPGALIGGGEPVDVSDEPQTDYGVRHARLSARRPRLRSGEPMVPFVVGPGGVVEQDHIGSASRATGVPAAYLSALIGHESGGDAKARAPTTSASGAAQFTNDTWLRTMRRYGAPYGDHILELSDEDLLELRDDPTWSALMAAEYARENAELLSRGLARPIRQNEAYLGHFLGPGDAEKLIRAAQEDARSFNRPRRAAEVVSSAAIENNPQVFYEGGRYERRTHPRTGRPYQHYLGGGRARTVGEVVARQSSRFSRDLFEPGERAHEALQREEIEAEVIERALQERAREANEERLRQRIEAGEQPTYADILYRVIMAPPRSSSRGPQRARTPAR